MESVYTTLIHDLKLQLKNKHIGFNRIFTLINLQNYDEIIDIIDDDTITGLIEDIIIERELIGNMLETKLNSLLWLNARLVHFKQEPQSSATKARKLLKRIYINIYDLNWGIYVSTTKKKLQKELRKHPERRFPLLYAKENITLKSFLIKIY